VEIEDTYIRLDKNVQDLLMSWIKKVGPRKYTVFIRRSRVAEVPQYLIDNSFRPVTSTWLAAETGLNEFLQNIFQQEDHEQISNDQVFLNQDFSAGDLRSSGIDLIIASELISKYLWPSRSRPVYSESVCGSGL